jgi:predicted nucleic acid-binding protein
VGASIPTEVRQAPVVLDNTVLSNFALVRRADLVYSLWPTTAWTTPAVWAEHSAGVAAGHLPADVWNDLSVVALNPSEEAFATTLSPNLGLGERSGIAVAFRRQGVFASDDRAAREAAGRHGVAITGTIGILLACLRRGHLTLDDANDLLARMIAAGYRSPTSDLNSLIGP